MPLAFICYNYLRAPDFYSNKSASSSLKSMAPLIPLVSSFSFLIGFPITTSIDFSFLSFGEFSAAFFSAAVAAYFA